MGKFGRTWAMMKSSARILRQDKELLVFPILSAIFTVLLIASFVMPLFGDTEFARQLREADGQQDQQALIYAGLFAFYVLSYFIVVFFNSAIIACALKRMDGGDPTVSYGLSSAFERIGPIFAWALFAGTIGFILRMIEERSQIAGRIVVAILGIAWSVTAYLAVPALVERHLGPFAAFKESARLLKQSWGEQIIGGVGFGLVFFLLSIPAIGLIAAGGMFQTEIGIASGIVLAVIYLMLLAVIQSALQAIYQAAVYRYASTGQAPREFDQEALAATIQQR